MAYPKGTPRPAGSGRKKGTPNKNRVPAEELADALGINPYEVLLRFASGDAPGLGLKKVDAGLRAKAAAEATKYLHAQRRSLDIGAKEPIRVVIEDYTGRPRNPMKSKPG